MSLYICYKIWIYRTENLKIANHFKFLGSSALKTYVLGKTYVAFNLIFYCYWNKLLNFLNLIFCIYSESNCQMGKIKYLLKYAETNSPSDVPKNIRSYLLDNNVQMLPKKWQQPKNLNYAKFPLINRKQQK